MNHLDDWKAKKKAIKWKKIALEIHLKCGDISAPFYMNIHNDIGKKKWKLRIYLIFMKNLAVQHQVPF